MKKRLLSMLLAISVLISLIPGFTASAAEGDLPDTLTLAASAQSNIPSWIDLSEDPAGTADKYQLYLPGDAVVEKCFFSWEGGLSASYDGKTYESGALPIPAPGETATYTFQKGSETKRFIVETYQGSAGVKPIFIEIDESQGTIYAMNHDRNHQTTCTGIIYIDGEKMNLPKIKGRGNYSWQNAKEKRPYNIFLDKKTVILGIDCDKTKKWSLLANVNDHTLLRNKVAYDLAHQMGIGLDSATADMWMNGQYQGVYLVTPKTDSFVTDDGFLVENNNYAETIPISEGGDPTFYVGSSSESVSAGGGGGGIGIGGGWGMGSNGGLLTNIKGIGDNWLEGGVENTETVTAAAKAIRAYLEDAWAALKTTDGYNSKEQYYADFFDMPTTAAYYLLHEFVKNLEVQGGSIFFHRDGMTSADKLKGGPAWDFDNALAFNGTSFGGWGGGGGSSQNNYQRLDGWYITGQNRTGLLGSMSKHQDLLDETERIYNIYYRAFDDVCQDLLRNADLIEDSANMNFVRFTKETMNAFDVSSDKTIGAGTEWEVTYKKTDTWRDFIENLYRYTEGRARYFKTQMYDEAVEHGYGAIFEQGAYSDVTVYDTPAMTGQGTRNPDVAYARNAAGEIDETGNGQISFEVDLAEGYQVKRIMVEPSANYQSLLEPAQTGVAGGYRLTGVTGSVVITVETAATSQVTFACDEGVTIDVYKTQKPAGGILSNVTSTFPRNSDTGEVDVSGDGQVNFLIKVADGYKFDSVSAAPTANYKNLKGPADTGLANVYRLTKITGDVTVTVKATKVSSGGCEHDYVPEVTPATCTAEGYTTYTCSKCGDSYVDDATSKIAHNYQNGVCTVCGEKLLNVTIDCGEGASVTVLETQSVDGPKVENAVSANPRNGDTGLIDCSGEGQVNFVVNLQPGYELVSVSATPNTSYKNLKGPTDTAIENGYRATKVTGDFIITVTTKKSGEEPIPPYAQFVLDEGVSVAVYETQDLAGDPEVNPEMAFARDGTTGEIFNGGQVNFVVNVENGYKLNSITAEPAANYNNLKGPDETLTNNCYRITKMTGPVTVTITATAVGPCEHDYKAEVTPPSCTAQGYTTYTCSKCGDSYVGDYTPKIPHNYVDGVCTACGEKLINVTISCGDGASVTVLETQKADGPKTENAQSANPRDGDSGLIDCSGDGQVNFIVNLAEGYELVSVTAEPATSFKNLKGPADTGIENGYRITKVKGDFTITVVTRNTYEPLPPCAQFVLDEGVSVEVYDAEDPSQAGNHATNPEVFYARNFLVNFTVSVAEGYKLESVKVEPEEYYQALKGPDDTKVDNCYWITGLNGAVTVTIKATKQGGVSCEHDYVAVVTPPTCTEKGYTTYTCSKCGDSYQGDEVAALGHDFVDGVCTRCGEKETVQPFLFDDVKDDTKFYFDPVYWAFKANPQITNGVDDTHFGPDNPCTRGHVVTFLWRAAGCPEPKSTETPFKDLKKGAFYEKAVAWAVEQGITNGLSDDKFGPDAQCNRGQIVTFLWRYKSQPAPANEATPFKDLKAGAFYLKAVAWAVENEVTNGLSADKFGPDATCTRGQVVTFLSRATKD